MAVTMRPPATISGGRAALVVIAVATGCGFFAALLANGGSKSLVLALAGSALAGGLMLVRDRARFVLVITVMSIQFKLHKSLGPIDATVASGASALYLTSLDALVVVLYVLWLMDGTLADDLKIAFRSRIMFIPLVALGLSLPSLFVASNTLIAVAEVVRMLWMYAFFVYIAVRVRTRRDLAWVVVALFAVALVQGAIVVAQWRTGGTLGLSFLGEEQDVFIRSLDEGSLVRPSGTVIHPDLLAALVGPIALIGVALAVDLRRRFVRAAVLAGALSAYVPLVLSQTRAAIAAIGIATILLLVAYVASGRLRSRVLLGIATLSVAVGLFFWPYLQTGVFDSFTTDHFQLEVDARLELNGIALSMIGSSPILGVGLNNFMTVFDQFDRYGVIYPGFPAHNLYLLVFAETGVLGLIGLLAVLWSFFAVAVRVAASHDRFIRAVGAGIAFGFVFFFIEELLSYSLRGDIPSAAYWLLAGLAVACARLVDNGGADEALDAV